MRLEAEEDGGDAEGEGDGDVVVDGCKQQGTDPHGYPPDAFRYGSK